MAGKRSVAEVAVRATGGAQVQKTLDGVSKATERVGRQQTRLGQASASAGRSFSAQANGLGGLVGAYAGAAATVFAVTAAFQALNNAARFEQIIAGTNALAASLGLQGQSILDNIQEITKGQLTLSETAQAANIALSAGLNQEQIEQLTEVATRASRALGRSLTDSFTRLTRGVAKLEPELLDELGIFTRIEPAVAAYAKSIGKSSSQLTDFERRQAFANEAITEGLAKFGDVDLESKTASESLERLSASLQNIGTQVGLAIANFIVPLVEILGSGIPAAFAAAALGRLIFGKALDELGNQLEAGRARVDAFALGIQNKLSKAAKVGKVELNALSSATQTLTLNQTKGTSEIRAQFNELVKLSRAGKLSREQAELLAQAAASQIKLDNLRLTALNAKTKLTSKEAQEVERLRTRIEQLNGVQGKAVAVTNTQSAAILRLSAAFKVAGNAAISFGRGLLSIFNAFVLVTTVVSVIGAIGSTILQAFGVLDPVIDALKELTTTVKEFIGLGDQAVTARKGFQGLVDSLSFEGVVAGGVLEDYLKAGFEALFKSSGALSADQFIEALAKGLKIGVADLELALGPQLRELYDQFAGVTPESAAVAQRVADSLGTGLSSIAGDLEFIDGGIRATISSQLKYNNSVQQATDGTTAQGREQNKLAKIITLSQIAQGKLAEALAAGGARVATLDKLRAASLNRITELQKLLGETINEDQRDQIKLQLKSLQLEDNRLSKLQAQQTILEQTTDQIRKQFSTELKSFDKLTGFLQLQEDGTISLAKTQKEQRALQISQLNEAIARGKDALAIQRAGIKLSDDDVKLAEQAEIAEKAVAGLFVKTAEAIRNINKELDKRNELLKQQLKTVELQTQLVTDNKAIRINQNQIRDIQRILDLENKRLERIKQQRAEQRKLQDALTDSARSVEQAIISQFGDLLPEGAAAALEIKFKSQDVDKLQQRINDDIKALEDNSTQREIATSQQNLLLEQQKKLLKKQSDTQLAIANAQSKTQVDALKLQKAQLQERLDLIKLEADTFDNHIEGIAAVLSADLTRRRELQEGSGFGLGVAGRVRDADLSASQISEIEKILSSAVIGTDSSVPLPTRVADAVGSDALGAGQIRAIENVLNSVEIGPLLEDNITKPFETAEKGLASFGTNIDNLETALLNLNQTKSAESLAKSIDSLDQQILKNTDNLIAAKAANADNAEALKNNLAALIAQRDALKMITALNSTYNRTVLAVGTSLQNSAQKGLEDFFQAIADGTLTMQNFKEGFMDFLRNTIEGVRKAVLQETLIDPVKDFIGKQAFSFLDIEQKGADNAIVRDGALLVTSNDGTTPKEITADVSEKASSVFDTIKGKLSEFGEKGAEIFSGFGDKLKGVFGAIGESAKGIFQSLGGEGGILQSIGGLFSGGGAGGSGGGIGSFFSGIFGGGVAGASGGFVPFSAYQRLAAGGQARDRVPALLEPGEFVMKRSSASSIGAPALNQMNATGKAGGNVVVNIQNQGTPQDATASEPRFDGEKFVIDIVTRDLRNNGPIRKSLRGGGAG